SYRDFAEGLKQNAAQTGRETAAWAGYYQKLADGAQGLAVTPPAPAPSPSVPDAPSPRAAPKPSITPVPLLRYTGAWVFPPVNGLFHGPQPEFIDLVVHEDAGHASGTLFARFKLPPGSPGDPELRF